MGQSPEEVCNKPMEVTGQALYNVQVQHIQCAGAAEVIREVVFIACATVTDDALTTGQTVGWRSPSNWVPDCSIETSRDDDEARVELIGDGQQHVLERGHVVSIAHLPLQPGHIDREALA